MTLLFLRHIFYINSTVHVNSSKAIFFCLFSWQEVDRTHEKVIEEQLQLNVYHHYLGQGKMYLYEKEFTR